MDFTKNSGLGDTVKTITDFTGITKVVNVITGGNCNCNKSCISLFEQEACAVRPLASRMKRKVQRVFCYTSYTYYTKHHMAIICFRVKDETVVKTRYYHNSVYYIQICQVKSTLNVPSVESFDRLCYFSYIQHIFYFF